MNVHLEACTHLNRVVQHIHQAGMKAGVTLNPSTPVCMLEDIAADVDMVLLMSVNPGFAAQQFIPGTLDKIVRLRQLLDRTGSRATIQIDGGINASTGKECVPRSRHPRGRKLCVLRRRSGSAYSPAPEPLTFHNSSLSPPHPIDGFFRIR